MAAASRRNLDRASQLEKTGQRRLLNFDDWKRLEKEVQGKLPQQARSQLPPIQHHKPKVLESKPQVSSCRKAGDFRRRKPSAVRLAPLAQKASFPHSTTSNAVVDLPSELVTLPTELVRSNHQRSTMPKTASIEAVHNATPTVAHCSSSTKLSEKTDNFYKNAEQFDISSQADSDEGAVQIYVDVPDGQPEFFDISSPAESNKAAVHFDLSTPEALKSMSLSVDVLEGAGDVEEHVSLFERRPGFSVLPPLSRIVDEGCVSTQSTAVSSSVLLSKLDASVATDEDVPLPVADIRGDDFVGTGCFENSSAVEDASAVDLPGAVLTQETEDIPTTRMSVRGGAVEILETSCAQQDTVSGNPAGRIENEEHSVLQKLRQQACIGMVTAAHDGNLGRILQISSSKYSPQTTSATNSGGLAEQVQQPAYQADAGGLGSTLQSSSSMPVLQAAPAQQRFYQRQLENARQACRQASQEWAAV